ncbi:MAG: MscS family membrane protein, partial [Myxococcota bacterium]
DVLKDKAFLMENWQWLMFFAVIVLGLILGRLSRWILRRPSERWLANREFNTPSDLILRVLKPLGLVVTALSWWTGLPWIGLNPGIYGVVIVMVKFLAAFGFVWFFFRVLDIVRHILADRAAKSAGRFDDLLVPLVVKSGKMVVVAVGVVFIANSVGISTTSLFAALGLGGLAVALAAQDTVKNFFGSLTVILDRPFEVGDAVIIGGTTEGVVEELGFRSTRIRTYENSLITLPNSNLISAKVDNLGRRDWRRLRTLVSVTYDTSPTSLQAFCEGLRGLIEGREGMRPESTLVVVNALAASSIDILFQCAFVTRDGGVALHGQHLLLLDVITLADRLGIGFAFPTQTVHLARPDDADSSADEPAKSLPILSRTDTDGAIRLGRAEAEQIIAASGSASAGRQA